MQERARAELHELPLCSLFPPFLGAAFTSVPKLGQDPHVPNQALPPTSCMARAWHELPSCPALPMSRTCKDLSLFFSISSPCSGSCQRKRLRYSDLDFEVSPAMAAGVMPWQ